MPLGQFSLPSPALRSNFAILQEHDEQLLRLGMLAERYFAEDPNTCLLKLRQLTEVIAQTVASHVGLLPRPEEGQYELLGRLRDQGILPREIYQLFGEVRRTCNAATIPNFINRAVQYIECEATLWGGEAEFEWALYKEGERQVSLTLMSDYVHGQNNTDGEFLPRIPPLRVGGRLEYQSDRFTFGVEARHSFAQNRLKPAPRGELPTDAYTLVGADASWNITHGRYRTTMTLALSNILNQEARLHTSFRKDVAPLPGFGATASVRWEF